MCSYSHQSTIVHSTVQSTKINFKIKTTVLFFYLLGCCACVPLRIFLERYQRIRTPTEEAVQNHILRNIVVRDFRNMRKF